MRACYNRSLPLASLAAGVLIASLGQMSCSEHPAAMTCGLTRALRTIVSVETARQNAFLAGAAGTCVAEVFAACRRFSS